MFDPDNPLDRLFVEHIGRIADAQEGQKEALGVLGLSVRGIADVFQKISRAIEIDGLGYARFRVDAKQHS